MACISGTREVARISHADHLHGEDQVRVGWNSVRALVAVGQAGWDLKLALTANSHA